MEVYLHYDTNTGKILEIGTADAINKEPFIVYDGIEWNTRLNNGFRPFIKDNNVVWEADPNYEHAELLLWFDREYGYKEQKLRRLIALNKLTDDGKDASKALIELYNEAEEKRKRIQELEKLC